MNFRVLLLIGLLSVCILEGVDGQERAGAGAEEVVERQGGGPAQQAGGGAGGSHNDCYFNGEAYSQNDVIEEVCIQMACKGGKWQTNGANSSCCECMVAHNDPHLYRFLAPLINNKLERYGFHGKGCYAFSQFGLGDQSNFLLEGIFVECPHAHSKTCIDAVVYHNLIDPDHQFVRISLKDDSQQSWNTQLNGDDFDVTGIPSAYHTKDEDDSDSTTLIIWKRGQCINLLGSRRDYLKVCKVGRGGQKGLYVTYCVPESFIKENDEGAIIPLYGLGGFYNGTHVHDFVKRNGSTTADSDEFGQSWSSQLSCPNAIRNAPVENVKCSRKTNQKSLKTCRKVLKDVTLTEFTRAVHEDACVEDLCGFAAAKSSKEAVEHFLVEVREIASDVGPTIKRKEMRLRGLLRDQTNHFDDEQPACGTWESQLDKDEQIYIPGP